jgi:hypothetical protein
MLYAQWISVNAPVITVQPTNVAALVTSPLSSVSFSAAATGTPTPTVQWQQSSNGGATWSSIGGATSLTLSVTNSSSNDGYEYEAIFSNAAGSTTTSAAQLTALATTSNWSGYVQADNTYTAVSGSWTVPTLTCNSSTDEYASEWVGIDGVQDTTVEQDGTNTDCDGSIPEYGAWWEMYGDDTTAANDGYSVELSPVTYPVAPGDVISASVNFNSGANEWTLGLSDATAHWTFSTNVVQSNPSPDQSSAEWIVESPEICPTPTTCAQGPLSDFGSVTFTNASATTLTGATVSILSAESLAVEMADGSNVVQALPGVLSDDGSIFTDTWLSST